MARSVRVATKVDSETFYDKIVEALFRLGKLPERTASDVSLNFLILSFPLISF
jgi:hypothetical protein